MNLSPVDFFPPLPSRSPLTSDFEVVRRQFQCQPTPTSSSSALSSSTSSSSSTVLTDPLIDCDLSLLVGPLHCSKHRLLLQLSYNLASRSSSSSSSTGPNSTVAREFGDPLQPVVIILPKRRNLVECNKQRAQPSSSSSSSSPSTPIVGIFGQNPRMEIMNKIKIKSVKE